MRITEVRTPVIYDETGNIIGKRPETSIDVTDEAVLYHIHEVLRMVAPEFHYEGFKWYQWLKKRHQKLTAAKWQEASIRLLQKQMEATSTWIVARGGKHAHDVIEAYADRNS